MDNTKPNIFFDFDGFQFHTAPSQVAWINHYYGINSTLADYPDGTWFEEVVNKYLNRPVPFTREEVYRAFSHEYLISKEWHKDVEPIEDMPEVIHKLAKKYTLWTVTARQMVGIDIIRHLLDTHVPNCMQDIHCVWRFEEDIFKNISKRTFMEKIPGEKLAFFDDSPTEIVEIQSLMTSYLFDPNGKHDHRQDITHRVRSWKEIGELFS